MISPTFSLILYSAISKSFLLQRKLKTKEIFIKNIALSFSGLLYLWTYKKCLVIVPIIKCTKYFACRSWINKTVYYVTSPNILSHPTTHRSFKTIHIMMKIKDTIIKIIAIINKVYVLPEKIFLSKMWLDEQSKVAHPCIKRSYECK